MCAALPRYQPKWLPARFSGDEPCGEYQLVWQGSAMQFLVSSLWNADVDTILVHERKTDNKALHTEVVWG